MLRLIIWVCFISIGERSQHAHVRLRSARRRASLRKLNSFETHPNYLIFISLWGGTFLKRFCPYFTYHNLKHSTEIYTNY
jgi:hypothetical protein